MKTKPAPKTKSSRVPLVMTGMVTTVAASGITILATTQTKPAPTPHPNKSPERELRVLPDPLRSETGATIEPDWQLLMLVGYDESGEPVELILDHHPLAILDAWPTGPGDANHDGVVDLADLNLVLANMGTDYRAATDPDGEPTP